MLRKSFRKNMNLRELINRLEELSCNGKNDNEKVVTRDIETCVLSDILSADCITLDNGNCIFEIATE